MRRDRIFDLEEVIKHFQVEGKYRNGYSFGEGHINDTYLVETITPCKSNFYILQRINDDLFKDVDVLMNNIDLVTSYARKSIIERGGDPLKETLTIIKTKEDKLYYFDGEDYFRVMIYIPNSFTYQQVSSREDFYKSAVSFGEFSALLDGFDASKLVEIIPDFHNTVKRFENFKKALEADSFNRKREVLNEIDFVLEHEDLCNLIVSKLGKEIPLRVTHNDTKLNNILFDKDTNKPLAVVDLDTVMPGCLAYDFGDSIRFGCTTGAEDEEDLSKVNFRIDLFEAYVDGYLKGTSSFITPNEIKSLTLGAILMTFECGMRFLTDYLSGDTYFKVSKPYHNLYRCRTQFKLVSQMLERIDELNEIVSKYANK